MKAEHLVELTDDDLLERHLRYQELNYFEDIIRKAYYQRRCSFFQNVLSAGTEDEIQNAIESFPAYSSKKRYQERSKQLSEQNNAAWYSASGGLPYWYKDEQLRFSQPNLTFVAEKIHSRTQNSISACKAAPPP